MQLNIKTTNNLIKWWACMCTKLLQSCPTLCDPMDYSPPGSSVHGILQARILEWVAMPSPWDLPSSGNKPTFLMFPVLAGGFFTSSTTWEAKEWSELKWNESHLFMSNSLWPYGLTVAHQALLSMGFPREGYWSGLPFASPGDLPDPGNKLMSPALAGGFFTTEPPRKPNLEVGRPLKLWYKTQKS